MLLHDKVVERIGPKAVVLGSRVTGYRKKPDGGVSALIEHADGSTSEADGALLIGADGIHSAIRAQMHPDQPPIHWGGAVMWRGTTWAKPIRTGASFVGLGTHRQRVVFYPISHPDPRTGLSMINWIAEVTMDNSEGWKQTGWFRQVSIADFVHHFDNWIWDWLDVPALLRQADCAFENPMIDRDPVHTWRDGPVALLGDAAHAMYPTGSNGGEPGHRRCPRPGSIMVEHGVTPEALAAYDDKLCGPISQLDPAQSRSRTVRPAQHRRRAMRRHVRQHRRRDPARRTHEFMAVYKAAAGFASKISTRRPDHPQWRTRRPPLHPTVTARERAISSSRTRAITPPQSPGAGCRNSRIAGYQGLRSRSSVQRQSGWNGSSTKAGRPSAPATWATEVSTQITRSTSASTAAVSAKSASSSPRCVMRGSRASRSASAGAQLALDADEAHVRRRQAAARAAPATASGCGR